LLHHIPLPGVGGTTDMSAATASFGYYIFSSPTAPPTTYKYNVQTNISTVYSASRAAPFNVSDYVTEEFFASSTGGASVPVFVAHRRGLKLNGRTPTMLTGYGGFGDFYQPMWQDLSAAWLARGGAFAIACVRGGGEYGEGWHKDGMLENKQHAFDDFAAAADLLIAKGFASPKTLVAYGYSGGGLLVGVTEIQHPELFAAVAEEAGPVDVLRSYSYGGEAYWSTEVGSPVASEEQFHWLYDYAPLLHIRKGQAYPATFVMTSENDSTVSPAHAYKFAATLQWAQASLKPTVLYVAPHTGHVEAMTSARVLGDTEAFLWAYST
jgi:prolyl oligopeptidase